MANIKDVLDRARSVLKGIGVPEIRLPAPLVELVQIGSVTHIILGAPLEAGEYRLVDGQKDLRVELEKGEECSASGSDARYPQHYVSTELRKKLFPRAAKVYLHKVAAMEAPSNDGGTTPVLKPVGPWGSFNECVLAMQGRGYSEQVARRICGSMEAQAKKQEEVEKKDRGEDPGVMVGLFLPGEVAKALAVEDGEAPDELHVTMAYLGRQSEIPNLAGIDAVLEKVAAESAPLTGELSGSGRFEASESSDGKDVLFKTVDVPGLAELRVRVVEALKSAGYPVNEKHGFTPHVTLRYLDPTESNTHAPGKHPVGFDEITLAIGTTRRKYKLRGMKPLVLPTSLVLDRADKRTVEKVLKGFAIKLHKLEAPAEERYVLGVVLEPDVIDATRVREHVVDGEVVPASIGDTYSEEEVRKACHFWMENYAQIGLQHTRVIGGVPQRYSLAPSQVRILECFLAPIDFELNGEMVKKGTWLLAVRVIDDALWEAVKRGELTGFSIGAESFWELLSAAESANLPVAGAQTSAN